MSGPPGLAGDAGGGVEGTADTVMDAGAVGTGAGSAVTGIAGAIGATAAAFPVPLKRAAMAATASGVISAGRAAAMGCETGAGLVAAGMVAIVGMDAADIADDMDPSGRKTSDGADADGFDADAAEEIGNADGAAAGAPPSSAFFSALFSNAPSRDSDPAPVNASDSSEKAKPKSRTPIASYPMLAVMAIM